MVFGMPRAAYELGAVVKEVGIGRMAEEILKACAARQGSGAGARPAPMPAANPA